MVSFMLGSRAPSNVSTWFPCFSIPRATAFARFMSRLRFREEKKTTATLILVLFLRVNCLKQVPKHHARAAHAEIGRELRGSPAVAPPFTGRAPAVCQL